VQNITDVGHLTDDQDAGEDKMLKGALREGKTAWQVADTYIEITDKEAQLLGIKKPTQLPRATDFISQQIDFIKQLEEKGYVYTSVDGVYFDTSKLQRYGELARLDIQGLQFGARVEQSGKKNPTDFALWKFSPSDQKRDMEWDLNGVPDEDSSLEP
jgi:cysteinyl-tRNA synthetase